MKRIFLSEVDKVTSIDRGNNLIAEVNGTIRRVSVENLAGSMGSNHSVLARKTYYNNSDQSSTLAQSGNPDVVTDYLRNCKLYVFNSSGTKKAEVYQVKGTDPSSMTVVFADGTEKTTSVLNTAGCNFMVKRPELGILSTQEDGRDVLYFAGTGAIAGGYQMPAKYIGMFKAYYDSTTATKGLKSQPNRVPTGNLTITTHPSSGADGFFQKAQEGGKGYGLWNYTDWCKENAIHLSYFGNTNYEVNVGTGRINNYDKVKDIVTGYTLGLYGSGIDLMKCGTKATVDTDGTAVNCLNFFGLEGLGEQYSEFIQGIRFNDTQAFIWNNNAMTQDYNVSDVRTLDRAVTGTSGNCITLVKGGKYFDMLPDTTVLDTTFLKGFCDGGHFVTAGRMIVVGGAAGEGLLCGLSYSRARLDITSLNRDYCARLAFYGDPQTVTGSELLS